MADYYFRCHRDYDHAQEELAIARPGLPNSTPFFILSGYINRRRNHWLEAERDFATAVALDPRNPNAYNLLSDTYVLERRFPEAAQVYDRVIASGEQTPIVRYRQTSAKFFGTADSTAMRAILAEAPDLDVGGRQTPERILLALIDGNYAKRSECLRHHPGRIFKTSTSAFISPKLGLRR